MWHKSDRHLVIPRHLTKDKRQTFKGMNWKTQLHLWHTTVSRDPLMFSRNFRFPISKITQNRQPVCVHVHMCVWPYCSLLPWCTGINYNLLLSQVSLGIFSPSHIKYIHKIHTHSKNAKPFIFFNPSMLLWAKKKRVEFILQAKNCS